VRGDESVENVYRLWKASERSPESEDEAVFLQRLRKVWRVLQKSAIRETTRWKTLACDMRGFNISGWFGTGNVFHVEPSVFFLPEDVRRFTWKNRLCSF
jgi:hypothetical protein